MARLTSHAPRAAAPQSVDRIFGILGYLASERGSDTLAGIARATKAPKTSLVGLLAGMLEGGYLSRDDRGRYLLGPRMLSLALNVAAKSDLASLVRPVLADLVAQTGETVLIGVLAPEGDIAMYIDKVESANPVRYTVSLGERRELYCTAIGKLLLAHIGRRRQDDYLRHVALRRFTDNTIASRTRLKSELEKVCREGIARTNSERVAGASAVAVPIFGAAGDLVAGITLAGPSERMEEQRPHIEACLREAGLRATALVAGRAAVTPL